MGRLFLCGNHEEKKNPFTWLQLLYYYHEWRSLRMWKICSNIIYSKHISNATKYCDCSQVNNALAKLISNSSGPSRYHHHHPFPSWLPQELNGWAQHLYRTVGPNCWMGGWMDGGGRWFNLRGYCCLNWPPTYQVKRFPGFRPCVVVLVLSSPLSYVGPRGESCERERPPDVTLKNDLIWMAAVWSLVPLLHANCEPLAHCRSSFASFSASCVDGCRGVSTVVGWTVIALVVVWSGRW